MIQAVEKLEFRLRLPDAGSEQVNLAYAEPACAKGDKYLLVRVFSVCPAAQHSTCGLRLSFVCPRIAVGK